MKLSSANPMCRANTRSSPSVLLRSVAGSASTTCHDQESSPGIFGPSSMARYRTLELRSARTSSTPSAVPVNCVCGMPSKAKTFHPPDVKSIAIGTGCVVAVAVAVINEQLKSPAMRMFLRMCVIWRLVASGSIVRGADRFQHRIGDFFGPGLPA